MVSQTKQNETSPRYLALYWVIVALALFTTAAAITVTTTVTVGLYLGYLAGSLSTILVGVTYYFLRSNEFDPWHWRS